MSIRYPLDRRMGGPKNRSERHGEEKKITVKALRKKKLLFTPTHCIISYV
jgi:hypothetical protein